MTDANTGDRVIGFMNAAFGLRAVAGFFAAGFAAAFAGLAAALAGFAAGLAAAAFATGFFAAGFAAALAAGFAAGFAAAFFGAVAILRLLHKCLEIAPFHAVLIVVLFIARRKCFFLLFVKNV